jgi:hypothetical protein
VVLAEAAIEPVISHLKHQYRLARCFLKPLPEKLNLTLVEIEAGRSSQATLPSRSEMTVESHYLSPARADELKIWKYVVS